MSKAMTLDEKIEELEKLEKAATPKFWMYGESQPDFSENTLNAKLCCEMRNALPELIAEYKRLKEFRREALELIRDVEKMCDLPRHTGDKAAIMDRIFKAEKFLKRWEAE